MVYVFGLASFWTTSLMGISWLRRGLSLLLRSAHSLALFRRPCRRTDWLPSRRSFPSGERIYRASAREALARDLPSPASGWPRSGCSAGSSEQGVRKVTIQRLSNGHADPNAARAFVSASSRKHEDQLEYKADSLILFFSERPFRESVPVSFGALYPHTLDSGMEQMGDRFHALLIFFRGSCLLRFRRRLADGLSHKHGDMDRILLRPVSPIQILTFTMGIHGIGNMVMGAVLFVLSCPTP